MSRNDTDREILERRAYEAAMKVGDEGGSGAEISFADGLLAGLNLAQGQFGDDLEDYQDIVDFVESVEGRTG